MVIISDVETFFNDKPEKVENVCERRNISYVKSSKKYIIRKTMNGQDFYYGSFDNPDDCFNICCFLERMNFPRMLCMNQSNYSGRKYVDWLKNELRKRGFEE